jgi:hypothetical protein
MMPKVSAWQAIRKAAKSIHIFFPPQGGIVKDCGIPVNLKLRPLSGAFPPRSLNINDSAKLVPLDPAVLAKPDVCLSGKRRASGYWGFFSQSKSGWTSVPRWPQALRLKIGQSDIVAPSIGADGDRTVEGARSNARF